MTTPQARPGPRLRPFQDAALRLGLLLLLLAAVARAQPCRPDTSFTGEINRAVEACIRQDWNAALTRLDRLVARHSWHPAPWFFRATVHSYRMTDEESFRWERAFLSDLDSAQARVDRLRAGGRIPACSVRHLEGSIQAWRAYHAGRREQWPSAVRAGLAASRIWEDLLEDCPGWPDLELGVGNLRFWTSVKLKRLSWLPFVEDRREEGRALVEHARRAGRYSRWLPAANLCWIYLELGRPDSTLSICRQGLSRFPGARLFLFPKAEALEAQGRLREADGVYREILAGLERDPWPQRFNKVVCLERRAMLASRLGDAAGARRLARQAMALPLQPDERKRLEEKLERLGRLAR